jgi:hypothetical protein
MQNLTAYMIPGAGPAKQVATKALPYVKKGVQSLFTKPGVVQKTIPKMKQMADGTVKQIGTKTVDKAGRVMSVPRASATAIGAAGLYDNAVSPNPYGGAGPVTDRQVVNRQDAPNIFNQGAAGQPPSPPPPPASSYWSDTWDRARAPAAGGSGAWDTNLYRLGEQMSHMGTPLSKRGKGPSDRWTTANTAANTLKASINKANKPKVTKPLIVSAASISPYINTALIEEFSSTMGFGGMSKAEMDGEAKLMAENVRKRVKAIEDKYPGKRADIKKIADDELAKFRVRYNK